MRLSKFTLKNIPSGAAEVPGAALFELPEKVLQFGTGVLLRGLPDYFIDKANKQGIFNGRIVVVKSTEGGDADSFDKQDGLYSLCVRGSENGKKQEENIICASISRVLAAKTEWNKILECAHNPSLQVIISNTTEVGINLVHDDIRRYPPVSFPGKLLAFLFERYTAFGGSRKCGMVIIPTELIPDNGKKLESIVLELAYLNGLDETFIDWLENCNRFCNSLVDRIVPGKPAAAVKAETEKQLGYTDELMTSCEVYRLWAIEGDESIAAILSFAAADKGVVIAPDINTFRELKLRLLNGTHTLSCGVAFLAGMATVKSAMADVSMRSYISQLMRKEIAMAIPYPVPAEDADAFALAVLERFSNPFIEHQWLAITLNYTSKMRLRIVPVLLQYYKNYELVPEHLALGFAAYLVFMKAVKEENGNYFGISHGQYYLIQDERAGYFYEKWQSGHIAGLVMDVLSDHSLWGQDLSQLPGFASALTGKTTAIINSGMAEVLQPSQASTISA